MAAWVQREVVTETDRRFKERLQKLCLFVGGGAVTVFAATFIVPELLLYS